MAAPRREYDPKRRPNIFYKNDPASNEELRDRARSRGQDDTTYSSSKASISEKVSSDIGYDMAKNSKGGPTVSSDGSVLHNVTIGDHDSKRSGKGNATISGGVSVNMPISGTALGKTKGLMQGKG